MIACNFVNLEIDSKLNIQSENEQLQDNSGSVSFNVERLEDVTIVTLYCFPLMSSFFLFSVCLFFFNRI